MIRLIATRIYQGASVRCGFAAVAGQLDVPLLAGGRLGEDLAALNPYFLELLAATGGASALPGPIDPRRVEHPRAAAGLVVAWLAAQLQNLAGASVRHIDVACGGSGEIVALSGYESPEFAHEAMRRACMIFDDAWEAVVAEKSPAARADAAAARAGGVVLEQRIAGNDHRLLVVGGD